MCFLAVCRVNIDALALGKTGPTTHCAHINGTHVRTVPTGTRGAMIPEPTRPNTDANGKWCSNTSIACAHTHSEVRERQQVAVVSDRPSDRNTCAQSQTIRGCGESAIGGVNDARISVGIASRCTQMPRYLCVRQITRSICMRAYRSGKSASTNTSI